MMKLKSGIAVAILLIASALSAQKGQLYMPIEMKKAYQNGTRNWDGTVSENYFQNHCKYDIEAELNPATRKLRAQGTIVFYNESLDTLSELVIHSYKDIYPEGMILHELSINCDGTVIAPKNVKKYPTHYIIGLHNNPILPKDSAVIKTKWTITVPETVYRDGAYDKTSMMVAYWYPEISVYDDIYGWDEIDFDGSAEFYHENSDYNITIKLPDNFVIWASDAPVNAGDIYPSSILKRLDNARNTVDKVVVIDEKDLKKGLKMKSNIWKYAIKNVPDFNFAISDHFLWEACTYKDEFGSYFLNSAYPAKNSSFSDVLEIEKDVMNIFHHDFPKYPFPYKHFVAFNGETGGGMEFVGMCNDEARTKYTTEGNFLTDYESNKLLTAHEMMHAYFPFLMGINEKRWAWMDEGMAEFAEDAFTGIDLESTKSRIRFAESENPPLMVETFTIPKTYVINCYDKPSQAYYALMQMLGKDTFDKCMKAYMDRWNHKHPTPYDFFFTFNEVSDQNLNWFWKAWFFDWGYPDVSISDFSGGKLSLTNEGGLPIGLDIKITFDNGAVSMMKVNPNVWSETSIHEIDIDNFERIEKLQLITLNGDDAIRENNYWSK